MSLTQHLRGRLGQWLSQHCPAIPVKARQLAENVRHTTLVEPPRGAELAHLAQVGGAVDARLALATDGAPPYGALMGAVRAGAVAAADAGRYVCTWSTHSQVPAEDAAVGLWLRTLPSGQWVVFGDMPSDEGDSAARRGFTRFLREFRDLAATVPPGCLGTRSQEDRLAQLCLTAGELESYYRSGHLSARARAVVNGETVPDEPAIVADVSAVVRHNADTLDRARRNAGTVLGTSAPVLLPQWAEGDLVLGRRGPGQGQTLVDVKTSRAAHQPDRVVGWLQQIVAYALCDGLDNWQIQRVGLWLARHGRIYSWPLSEFTDSMTAPAEAFREHALSCYHADRDRQRA